MRQPRQNKAIKYFISTILLIVLFAANNGEFDKYTSDPKHSGSDFSYREIYLTPKAERHILYGDTSGGGHKFGVNKPCKSEFPKEWNNQKIITTIKNIAANDNLAWVEQSNGYYVTETFDEDVKLRVILGKKKLRIISAYPINRSRNPCPYNN